MRAFRLSRPATLTTLAAGAAAAVIGCQHLLTVSTAATAPTTFVAASAPAFQRLETQKATFQQALYMPAAIQSGTFEDAFKPLPPIIPPTLPEIAPVVAAYNEPEQHIASVSEATALVFESGIASTYGQGDGFDGERTGCGQIFHTDIVQVAHKSLPCGTVIRIEDVDTGKSVEAEVTDRGPYVSGRIVDLSLAAFTKLDPSGTGLLNVNVYVIDSSNQYLYRLR